MKMTKELATEIVKRISSINSNIPNLNCGGCGSFAVFFAEEMNKYGFDAKIIQLADSDIDSIFMHSAFGCPDANYYRTHFDEKNKIIHDAAINHTELAAQIMIGDHYCVNIGDFYFDSTGWSLRKENYIRLGCLYEVIGEVPLTDLEYVTIEKHSLKVWNNKFHSTDNDKIKTILSETLKFLPNA
jgi:hypothetical protein